MVRNLVVLLLSVALMMTYSAPSFAQGMEGQITSRAASPRQKVATIIFAGLAGAILGLSTLSFYGRPQDKLNHIAYGGAIGVIIGASYTMYKSASDARPSYENLPEAMRYQYEPEAWKLASAPNQHPSNVPRIGTGWQWEF